MIDCSSIVGPPGAEDVSDTGFAFVLQRSEVARAGTRAPRIVLGGIEDMGSPPHVARNRT